MMSLGSSSMSSPEKPNAKDIVDLKVTSVPFFFEVPGGLDSCSAALEEA
jgi:hypothetical protein